MVHPQVLRFEWATTVCSPSFCFLWVPPWYLTVIPAASFPITSPSHHSLPLSDGHLTFIIAPWPIHCRACSGSFLVGFGGGFLARLALSCGIITDPPRFMPCQWVSPSSYFTLTPGMPLSSGHSSFVTLPLRHDPLCPPILTFPPGEVHATFTFVPTVGIQNTPGAMHGSVGEGTKGCGSSCVVSSGVSFLVPLAITAFLRGSFSPHASPFILVSVLDSISLLFSSSGFWIPWVCCCHLLLFC